MKTPAQAVKQELKYYFPETKFSCSYRSFSMWDAVDIERTDWPTEEQVAKISWKYQYWSFDGMTDMYEYTNGRDDIPQAKYVHERRELSWNVKSIIKNRVDVYRAGVDEYEKDRLVWQVWRKLDLRMWKDSEMTSMQKQWDEYIAVCSMRYTR